MAAESPAQLLAEPGVRFVLRTRDVARFVGYVEAARALAGGLDRLPGVCFVLRRDRRVLRAHQPSRLSGCVLDRFRSGRVGGACPHGAMSGAISRGAVASSLRTR